MVSQSRAIEFARHCLADKGFGAAQIQITPAPDRDLKNWVFWLETKQDNPRPGSDGVILVNKETATVELLLGE